VRVQGAPIWCKTFAAVGMAPTVIAYNEVYNAIQNGVIAAGEKTEAAYFKHLTGAWVQVAYAVLPVSNTEMNTLCDQWPFETSKMTNE